MAGGIRIVPVRGEVANVSHDPNPQTQPAGSEAQTSQPSAWSVSRVLHIGVAVLAVGGAAVFWWMSSGNLNPVADPNAAKAMALVQTHRALSAPTIRQAIDERVKMLADEGRGVRVMEWKVRHERDAFYLVRIMIREEGAKQWFEREYVWRTNIETNEVTPLSLPAEGVMPVGSKGRQLPNLPPH